MYVVTMDMGMRGLANCKLHFLAPHPSTFGLVWKRLHQPCLKCCLPFFLLSHREHHTWRTPQEVNDMLCDGLIPRNCIFKENHTFRKILPSKCNLTLWTPPKIQLDRKLHIGRYQFSRFRENATSFSKRALTQNESYKTQSVDSTW